MKTWKLSVAHGALAFSGMLLTAAIMGVVLLISTIYFSKLGLPLPHLWALIPVVLVASYFAYRRRVRERKHIQARAKAIRILIHRHGQELEDLDDHEVLEWFFAERYMSVQLLNRLLPELAVELPEDCMRCNRPACRVYRLIDALTRVQVDVYMRPNSGGAELVVLDADCINPQGGDQQVH